MEGVRDQRFDETVPLAEMGLATCAWGHLQSFIK